MKEKIVKKLGKWHNDKNTIYLVQKNNSLDYNFDEELRERNQINNDNIFNNNSQIESTLNLK